MGEPRHYSQLTGIPGPHGALSPAGILLAHTIPLNKFISSAAIFLAAAQVIFLLNFFRSTRSGRFAASNPWEATTLEWHTAMNPFSTIPASDESEIVVHRAPCHYQNIAFADSFLPQWIPDLGIESPSGDTADAKPE
jgi:cytochrome c oxidase subunit 1